MPDKAKFSQFFKGKVGSNELMTKDQFILYPDIQSLLASYLVFNNDVDELWVSAVGDSKGLDLDEAYEMLCMTTDIPDPEDVQYYQTEFEKLTSGKGSLSFPKFLVWQDVQDMLADDALTMEDLTQLWRTTAGDLNTSIKIDLFRKLNGLIDDFLSSDDDAGTDDDSEEEDDVDPEKFFDEETLEELISYFNGNKNSQGRISLSSIERWGDIQEMVRDGLLAKADLASTWTEVAKGRSDIDLKEFVQYNIYLDLITDENESGGSTESSSGAAAPKDDDAEKFYRDEFKELMGDQKIMPFDIFVSWKDVTELLSDNLISRSKLESLFNSMPLESIGLPSTTLGITVDSFIRLNQILDILIDSSEDEQANTLKALASPVAVPVARRALTEEGPEPASTATESELELMKLLDTADNLLNSGSFEDFDKLIGDENDPRLVDARALSSAKQGDLRKDLDELVRLASKQKRCGLEAPDEFEAARIADAYQGVLQNCAPLVSRDIYDIKTSLNGRWKLLFSNSEMFRFYNGLTGNS